MSKIKQDYYTNAQGVQLYTYFEKVITPECGFSYSLTQGFYLLSAFKYSVRAGRKPDNPEEKDLKKIDDYVHLLAKHDEERNAKANGLDAYYIETEIRDWLKDHAEKFERFNGEEM